MTAIEPERHTQDEPALVPDRPTGLVTFLFTDVEGSTKLWEKYPEAMQRALARHDAIVRHAITSNGGLVFKTIGDAFCAAFSHAPSALLAAVDAQRDLSEEPWGETGPLRARMALHSGRTDERESDYFGPPVNRVARLLATGHGGQILVSAETRRLLHPEPPGQTDLRDLGQHRLKDLSRPERVFQAVAPGLPHEFKPLRSQPSPIPGVAIAAVTGLVGLGSFRFATRNSSDSLASVFSPLGLYDGFKGLVVELSTENEWLLLGLGVVLLAFTVGLGFARWRTARRVLRLTAREPGPVARWAVNQRTIAFLAALALTVLGAYGYQQYLWQVALPIPTDSLGFALTREAAAASFQDALADALFVQGQSKRIVVRQLPVKFDARDTDKARSVGRRIGAEATIIYRVDDSQGKDKRSYVAYLVFTDPDVGLTLGGSPETTVAALQNAGGAPPPVAVKERVDVPVLRTATLEQLVSAAAGILDYNDDRLREAIKQLEIALPADAQAPNTGIINFFLGNAYALDGQAAPAAAALERAATYYESQTVGGGKLGPQDELILVKTYLERGRQASLLDQWDAALAWYQKGLAFREDLVARAAGLERPEDVYATFARLYALTSDAYRAQGKGDDQRFWAKRASEEIDALAAESKPDDTPALIQESAARFFVGDCAGATTALNRALTLDRTSSKALINAAIVAVSQGQNDLAVQHLQRLLGATPNDVSALVLIASIQTREGVGETYLDVVALGQAEQTYREVLKIDPTNLVARQAIARIGSLRAQSGQLDATALLSGDALTVAKSQTLWASDPTHQQAVIEAWSSVIDELRVIASELRPDSPPDQVAVAEAYASRQSVRYSRQLARMLSGSAAGTSDKEDGDQILADAAQIRQWTDPIIADASSSRLTLLRAWSARLTSLDNEWGWYAISQDVAKATALQTEFGQAVQQAVAVADAQPLTSGDETDPMTNIYLKAQFVASAFDQDTAAADGYAMKAQSARNAGSAQTVESSAHLDTFCAGTQERTAGDLAFAKGDFDGAKQHYQAALAANPNDVAAMIGDASALFRHGDVNAAIAQATAATVAAPDDPAAWAALALYQTAAADTSAPATYDRFFQALAQRTPQARLAAVRTAVQDLARLFEDKPESAASVRAVGPRVATFLDGMATDGAGTFQYPQLYASLGMLLLDADAAAGAEPVARKAISLDPHQPIAHADLVLAVLAQDHDANAELTAAMKETEDPLWHDTIDFGPDKLLTLMEQEAADYSARFPERAAKIDALNKAIAAERERQTLLTKGIDGNAYKSPVFGIRLTWDASWSSADASSDGTVDSLTLGNGQSVVHVVARAEYRADPGACLSAAVANAKASPGWTDFALAKTREGTDAQASAADRAFAAYVFRQAGKSGVAQDFVLYLNCRVLSPGTSGVLVVWVTPATVYGEQRDLVGRLLATLLPPTASGATEATPVAGAPVSLPDLDLRAITAALPGINGSTYASPTYGYRLTWDDTWGVEAASSQGGYDFLQLSNGQSRAYLEAFVDQTRNPESCLQAVSNDLTTTSTIHDVVLMKDADGKALRGRDAIGTYAVFSYTSDLASGGSTDEVLYVSCGPLATTGAVVRFEYFSSRDRYTEEAAQREVLLKGLVLPPAASTAANPATAVRLDASIDARRRWTDPRSSARIGLSRRV